jgi:hypothetical protein
MLDGDGDGEGEIVNLARRILDLTEDGRAEGEANSQFNAGPPPPGVGGAQHQSGQQEGGNDHAALRASVHSALKGGR